MGDRDGNDRNGDNRRLLTPLRHEQNTTNARHSRSRSPVSSRSQSSYRRRLQQRETELERERQRVLLLERELLREREEDRRSRSERQSRLRSTERSERRSRRPSYDRTERRSRRRSTERRSRISEPRRNREQPEQHRQRERHPSGERRALRSRSPVFSSKDILSIMQSLKSGLPSHAINQGSQMSMKSLDYKNIIPEFDPSTKNQRIDVWLKKVKECASVYSWDEKTTVHFAMQKLRGLAKTWYESQNSILFSWPEWQEKLTSAFPCDQNYGQSLEEMLKRRSRFNEPIEVYFYEKLALLNNCEITGKRAVDCLIHGISDKTTKSSALALRCSEPDVLLQFLMSNKESHAPQFTSFKNKVGNGIPGALDNNFKNNRPAFRQTSSTNSNVVYCFNCKEKGHPYLQCPKPLVKCTCCHNIGHVTENCYLKEKSTNADKAKATLCISNMNPNDKFYKNISVNGLSMEAFMDFGSEVTLIKESSLSLLNITHDGQPAAMKGFGNQLVQCLGSVSLNLTVDDVDAAVQCRVVKDHLLDRPLLVGQSFSEQPHIIVVKDATNLRFHNIGAEMPKHDPDVENDQFVRIRVKCHSVLHGIASVKAVSEAKFTGDVLLETKVIGKPNQQFVVCGGAYPVKDGALNVIITPCNVPCLLHRNAIFARGERVEVVNRIMTSSDVIGPSIENSTADFTCQADKQIDISQVRLGDSVTEDVKLKLIDLLQRYKHCFADDLSGLGCTDSTAMTIELNSQRPVVYRPYRLSYHERDKVRDMVDDMLEAGIIRESVSSYASPIILVKKKDGKLRLCIDYRMLNSLTVKERYPMPIIEDEIARLSGQAWFVSLDLMSGYYQVPISESSRHLTEFVTPDGQYEFNRMPFGLANAPAVFQRMMNQVLGPVRFDKATVYMDDLLVFGRSPEECLDRLEEVLKLLTRANLKLNLSKCSFLRNKIEYLGYEIGSEGIRPGEGKIQSVVDFPCPQNVHGVRQFLGLVSYFRKFIYGFAQIAQPLTRLLKKNNPWQWEKDQEEAFKMLKAKLVKRPVLAIYDPKAETELHTDASRVGVGGILLQRQHPGDTFKPVAYYSRQTTPEEKNFHSYELETLAVVCALKKFRVYLLGKEFRVVTDCSALRSTFQKRDLIPRIARWWLAFQEYDCSIEYRAGVKMSHVDALSRNPISDTDTENLDPYPAVMAISDEDWLLTLQLGDSELLRIRDILCSGLDSKGLEYIKDNYLMKNNRLFRCIERNKEDLRWVVPKGARWQVCRLNHDEIGHLGYEKTLDRIKKTYWFSKMSRFVRKYVNACIECAYAKHNNNTREGLLHPIVKVEKPFHTVHIDHLGPFVRSKQGHTHILVTVDSFTKFVFIKSVRNTKTQNVIKVLDTIFDTFRAPDRLISDRGSSFTSHAFRKYCLDRGIKHVLNAVASPRANGQVERYNRTILDSLTASNLNHDERDWDTKLGKIQWGLNNSLQKTTGRSPSEIMFGAAMTSETIPILNELADVSHNDQDVDSIRNEVKDRIDKEQVKAKERYDEGRRPARAYVVGELVKITKTVFQNNGKSSRLLPSYEGPYKVVRILGNDRYKVAPIPGFEGMKNRRKTTVAADRMRPWIHLPALELNEGDDVDNLDSDENDGILD